MRFNLSVSWKPILLAIVKACILFVVIWQAMTGFALQYAISKHLRQCESYLPNPDKEICVMTFVPAPKDQDSEAHVPQ